MEATWKNQMFLKLKNTITKVKISVEGLNSVAKGTEVRASEQEYITI